jgi:hypothetical protein
VETKILAGSPQRMAELKSTLGSDTGKLLDRSLSLARSRVCVRALALSLSDTQMCARTHTFTSQTAREAQHGAQGTGEGKRKEWKGGDCRRCTTKKRVKISMEKLVERLLTFTQLPGRALKLLLE